MIERKERTTADHPATAERGRNGESAGRMIKSDEEVRLEVFDQEERAEKQNESREGLEIKKSSPVTTGAGGGGGGSKERTMRPKITRRSGLGSCGWPVGPSGDELCSLFCNR